MHYLVIRSEMQVAAVDPALTRRRTIDYCRIVTAQGLSGCVPYPPGRAA